MSSAIYTESIIFRTTPKQAEWIKEQIKKLEEKFGEGFSFSDSDVIRRALYKEMRKEEEL